MSLNITLNISLDDWGKFVEKHPAGNVFQTPEMAEVFERTKLHKPLLFTTVNSKGEILSLILAVQVKALNWLPSRSVSRCIVYGGILAGEDQRPEEVSNLLTYLNSAVQSSTLVTEIRNVTDTSTFRRDVICCGFDYYDYLNYLIPLDRNPDEIFQRFSRTRRQNIRKLEIDGVHIQEACERADVSRIYDILRQTYARVKVPLADISLFQATFDVMHPLGMTKFYLAKMGPREIAVAVALLFKRTIYLWYLGTRKEFLRTNAASLLVWHLAKWGSLNGYEILDFLGAGRPEEPYGVREFKKRFGGNEVNYGRYQKIHAPLLLKFGEKAYEFYRKLL
ncbi:MAG: lipid II:glycine glycyltransferase FemX [Candidatus Hodarchaeota archaeon]